MMTILITGANGQLGSSFRALQGDFPSFRFLFTDVAELDICQPGELEAFFPQNHIDYVVNCAAYTAVDKAETDITFAHRLNCEAVRFLGNACGKRGIPLIHISTDYVFDGKSFFPYDEEAPVNPQSVYGFTKLNGERALQETEGPSMIIRTSWLYSPYGNNFVKTMLRLGREGKEPGVVFDQVGSPTLAGDLARAILSILIQAAASRSFSPGLFHFSNEGVCSWYDFAVETMKSAGLTNRIRPIRTADYPLPAPRPPFSVLDKQKIKQSFGLVIPHWRESLEQCMTQLM